MDFFLPGIKLQLLHVLKGTQMAEEYTDLAVSCLKILPPETIVHRIAGDGPKKLLLAPEWSAGKKRVLGTLQKAIREAERPHLS